jgi:hypothetical protein
MRRREIGPVGTVSRVVAGIAAVALVVWDGVGLWDLPAQLAAPFVAAIAARATTAVDGDVVFWGFVGASMLLGAVRGDGGCELLAFPNAITGRRDRIGCILFTPIDAAEARRGAGPAVRQGVR